MLGIGKMYYKAEPLKTNFGKGGGIENSKRRYEQFSCRGGLFARVYQDPKNTDYHGVIFRAPFQDTDQDYEQFRILAKRLQQASGEKVPNSKTQFIDYISYSGLEQKLSGIGAKVRINLEDRKGFLLEDTISWLNNRGYMGGILTGLAIYTGGFAIIANTAPDAELAEQLIMYGFQAPVFEGISGIFIALLSAVVLPESISKGVLWCGPMHAPGFFISKILHRNKLRNPNYMLEKFMQNYQKLDAIKKSHLSSPTSKSANRLRSQSKKVGIYFRVLENMFLFTEHQRGFSITYDSPNRDNVFDFLDYILEGGNAPQLPNRQTEVQKPKAQENPIKVEPVETNFINPWEVQIPKFWGKKNA